MGDDEPEQDAIATCDTDIQVLLVGCTGLLGEVLIDTVGRARDINVVAQLQTPAGLAGVVQALRPDVVVWNNADEALLSRSAQSFGCSYSTKFIAIVNDGRTSSLWELREHRTRLVELSPPILLSSIREAAGR